MTARRAGILVPLFSFPSSVSWGIGEITDIGPMAAWLQGGGQTVLQLLPLNEMAPGQSSPYSALSAMAIDPIYIHLPAVAEFAALGGERQLEGDDLVALEYSRRATRVDYGAVRRLKRGALNAAFERFHDGEWCRDTARAAEFKAFRSAQAWWLDDYSLFRAIRRQL